MLLMLSQFLRRVDCASCATLATGQVSFVAALGGDWDATFTICRSAGGPMGQHANTMGQDILGPLHGLKDFALSSTQIGRSWNLLRQSANRMWSAVARGMMELETQFLAASCSRCGSRCADMCAPKSLSAAASAPCRMVWGAHLPLHRLRERVVKAVPLKRGAGRSPRHSSACALINDAAEEVPGESDG